MGLYGFNKIYEKEGLRVGLSTSLTSAIPEWNKISGDTGKNRNATDGNLDSHCSQTKDCSQLRNND